MSIYDTYKELLKPQYVFRGKRRNAFIQLQNPGYAKDIDALSIGVLNGIIMRADEELQVALKDSWLPESVAATIAVMRLGRGNTVTRIPKPQDYWLIAKLTWEIQRLGQYKRDGVCYLTKSTSAYDVVFPTELQIDLKTYNAVGKACHSYMKNPYAALSYEDQVILERVSVTIGNFWSFITKELVENRDVAFYENVMDIYRTIHAKVPLVRLQGIDLL